MSNIYVYNLLNEYEISIVDGKVYWVSAEEWSPYNEGFTEYVEPDDIFTDYLHGEGEIIKGILVLHRPNEQTGDEADASRFYEELKAQPAWDGSECFVTGLHTPFPSIRYCKSGNHVPLDYAIYVLAVLGYRLNPDSGRSEKIAPEERSQQNLESLRQLIAQRSKNSLLKSLRANLA